MGIIRPNTLETVRVHESTSHRSNSTRPGWFDSLVRDSRTGTYHVVIVEEAEGSHAVVVSVNPHHRLGGCGQGVLQVGFPGLVFTGVGELLEVHAVVLHQAHGPETEAGVKAKRQHRVFNLALRLKAARMGAQRNPGFHRGLLSFPLRASENPSSALCRSLEARSYPGRGSDRSQGGCRHPLLQGSSCSQEASSEPGRERQRSAVEHPYPLCWAGLVHPSARTCPGWTSPPAGTTRLQGAGPGPVHTLYSQGSKEHNFASALL